MAIQLFKLFTLSFTAFFTNITFRPGMPGCSGYGVFGTEVEIQYIYILFCYCFPIPDFCSALLRISNRTRISKGVTLALSTSLALITPTAWLSRFRFAFAVHTQPTTDFVRVVPWRAIIVHFNYYYSF